MYTFLLYTFDDKGKELETKWEVLPVDREPLFAVLSNDKGRATGASDNRPFAVKEVWNITFGGGTLLSDDHRMNFLRMNLAAHKIIWRRLYKHSTIDTEFEVVRDQEFSFDYLQSQRSLKKKTIKIVEKEENYYMNFEAFLKQYAEIIERNALW